MWSECAAGAFVLGLFRHCMVVSRGNKMWSECAAGGFLLGVFRHCVVVSRGN